MDISPVVLKQAQKIVDRFGPDPDFRSADIKINEVNRLMGGLQAVLAPHAEELQGTALNLYKGLIEWRDSGRRYDRTYNLRAYLWQLSKTLVDHGFQGKPQESLDGVPF